MYVHKVAFQCLHSETSVVGKIPKGLAAETHLCNFEQELETTLCNTS